MVANIISKKELKKDGFIFSKSIYDTAIKKRTSETIEDKTYFVPPTKRKKTIEVKNKIIEYLKSNSDAPISQRTKRPLFYLKESKNEIYKKLKLNEDIEISKSCFNKLCPKNFVKYRKSTDLCNICYKGKILEKKNNKNSEEIKKYEAYLIHLNVNENQKKSFNILLKNLKENDIVILLDFKENIRLGGSAHEASSSFYNRSMFSIFGACLLSRKNGIIITKYINFLSKVLSHDSFFVINCIKELLKNYIQDYKNIFFYCDNAKHFRSAELFNFILNDMKNIYNKEISLNFWCEYHGKTQLDAHFGILQKTFNNLEIKSTILDEFDLKYNLEKEFKKFNFNTDFIIYDDIARNSNIKKLFIKNNKFYLSFININGKIKGSCITSLNKNKYKFLESNNKEVKEKRVTKYSINLKEKECKLITKNTILLMEFRKEMIL